MVGKSRQKHLPTFVCSPSRCSWHQGSCCLPLRANRWLVIPWPMHPCLVSLFWSVIMINLNTWDKSIRVFESWFNQHCKSRQSTNLEHWHSFKQNVARFFMVQVDMFKEVHSLRFSAEFLVMSPQPLFGLQGSSARGLRRPALGLAVLAHVQRVSRCLLRLPVRRSITCFLLRCQHAWRLQSVTTGVPARRVSRRVTMM